MIIKRIFLPLFSLSLIAILSGCNSSTDTLVMDLDAIASATGQADVITQQINAANQELTGQLESISQQLNEQLKKEREKLGKKLSKQDEDNLQQLTQAARQKMQQARNLATQKSQQYRNALIIQLRQQVSPIAERIARERKASVVMITSPSMMWFDPEADITADIIAELRAAPSTNTPDNSASQKEAQGDNTQSAKENTTE